MIQMAGQSASDARRTRSGASDIAISRAGVGASRVVCSRLFQLHSQRASESASRVVGLGAVMINEHRIVATIAEQGTAELPDLGRRPHPAGRRGVELIE